MAHILNIEMVPRPLFRVNLRKVLGQYGWRKLRAQHLERYDGHCQTCGKAIDKSPHLHEDWHYEVLGDEGVAKLVDMKFVCFYCHGCEHFGWLETFSRHPDTREDVCQLACEHYCAVNDVEEKDFRQDLREASNVWRARNKLKWEIDWGEFTPLVEARTA